MASGTRTTRVRSTTHDALTTRETQVLEMISRGLTNVEIAELLGVTVHAVKFHLNGVYRKLGVSNRTAAAMQYAQALESMLEARPASPAEMRAELRDREHPEAAAAVRLVRLELDGAREGDVVKALRSAIDRYPAMRTALRRGDDGELRAVVLPPGEPPVAVADLSGLGDSELEETLGALEREQLETGFDLASGRLVRASLVRVAGEIRVVLLAAHAAALDGDSLARLCSELDHFLTDPSAGLGGASTEIAEPSGDVIDHWRGRLADAQALDLPGDRPRPPIPSLVTATVERRIGSPASGQLSTLASGPATVDDVVAAGVAALLLRYCGPTRMLLEVDRVADFAVPRSGRAPLVLALAPNPEMSFAELVADVVAERHTAEANPVAYARLIALRPDEPDLSRPPLAQVRLRRRAPWPPNARPAACPYGDHDLSFELHVAGPEVELALSAATDLFDPATAARMLSHLSTLLAAAGAAPTLRLSALEMLGDDERERILVEWNLTEADFPAVQLQDLVAATAADRADSIAVAAGGEALTYSELMRRSDLLARHLADRGAGPGRLVGIAVERSVEMLVALLGVLSSGAAYVPIDPTYPAERVSFMLEDAAVGLVVTQSHLLDGLPLGDAEAVCIDRDWPSIERAKARPAGDARDPEDLAYVIYTSGSTGKPKGVEVSHRALVNFLTTMAVEPGLDARDVLVAVTTLSFDIAGLELYLPLVRGAKVVVASRDEVSDPGALAALLERSEATVMQATPTTWRLLVDAGWPGRPGMRALCGGEALPPALADALVARGVELWNMYGPTESTIWSTVARVERSGATPTIGRPIANTSLFVLDQELRPAPIGVPGELFIGGAGLARGYRGRPDLTAERFVPHPFDPRPGTRLYRTGDLVRYRPDGHVEFLGRLDHQVKVRGFRIELGEVESVLSRHPSVLAAVVVAREDEPGDPRLVGYVIADNPPPSPSELRHFAARSLPAYMVPSAVMVLDVFPTTPNGKVDRKALPAPPTTRDGGASGYVAPRTALEAALAEIWEEVLAISPIGVTDDFFELGATSIVAARLFARIESDLGAKLPLSPLFRAPTIERLAELLETSDADRGRHSSLVPIQTRGARPPLFCVHGGAGTILHLNPLARALGPGQPFYGLQARGLYGDSAPLTTVEAMAQHYVTELRTVQPHGPYQLAGYCFGSIVAYEMAQTLLADGEDVALLAMFNGPAPAFIREHGQNNRPPRASVPPVRLPRSRRLRRLTREPHRMVTFAAWALSRRANQAKWKVDQRRFRLELARGRPLPESMRDWGFLVISGRAEVAYEPAPYPGKILQFRGDGLFYDVETGWGDRDLGWAALARGGVTTHVVPGDHRDNRQLMKEPSATTLAGLLAPALISAPHEASA